MKGDFTRFTFRRADHYSGVRLQQGRVQVDADWNEQVDLQLDRERVEIRDVVGLVGAPWAEPGFGVVPLPLVLPGGHDFALSPGRMYVDGILVEVGGEKATASEVKAGSLVLPSGYLDGAAVKANDWLEIRGSGSAVHRARVSGADDAAEGKRQIDFAPTLPDPTSFANAAVRRLATYLAQPDLASPPAPAAGTSYLAYLEVWERHVTAHDAPRLREVALGGPDTATRTQVAWRVRLEEIKEPNVVCATFGPGWRPQGQGTGRLRAQAQPAQAGATPCIVPQGAGYRRLENQLYRVEIHAGGGAPTYKWSRDNGHVVSRVRSVFTATSEVEVEPRGRDDVLDFAPGQVVEITGAGAALRGETGLLAAVTEEADGTLTLEALPGAPALDLTGVAAGWEVRRWDGTAAVDPGKWVELEEGVQVWFEAGGVHLPGDWWAIPARTAGGDVEWPREGNAAVAVPPHGVARAYCPLSILQPLLAGGGWKATDCRKIFPPLTSMVRMVYLGGDGQEAMPTTPDLRYPLQVGVMNGGLPVEGAVVRFTVAEGGGLLNGGAGFVAGPVLVSTVAGVASVQWRLGTAVNDQRVRAELLQHGAEADHPDLHFNANLSEARQVHFAAPAGCAGLAGSTTVQDALERLARTANLFYVGGDGQHAAKGKPLEQPLTVRLVSDCGPVKGVTVTFAATDGGLLSTTPAAGGKNKLEVATDADGKAEAYWRLADPPKGPAAQQVTASVPDPGQLPAPWLRGGSTSVEFGATWLLADQVQYQPGKCDALKGVGDVQAALDLLCQREGGRKGITVTRVAVHGADKMEILNDNPLQLGRLAKGIAVHCSKGLDPLSFNGLMGRKPVCSVTVDIPFFFEPQQTLAAGVRMPAGTLTVALDGTVRVEDSAIVWTPSEGALWYLVGLFGKELEQAGRLLAHLTLKGRFIWGKDEPRQYLGGMAFGVPDAMRSPTAMVATLLELGGRGGEEGTDFEMWFWIVPGGFDDQDRATGTRTGGSIPNDFRIGGVIAPGGTVTAGGATLRATDAASGGAVALESLEMPATLGPGEPLQGTVRLSGSAPRGGFEVTLSTGDKRAGGKEEVVVVPAGKTEAPFRLDLDGAKAGSRVTITATTAAGALNKRVAIK